MYCGVNKTIIVKYMSFIFTVIASQPVFRTPIRIPPGQPAGREIARNIDNVISVLCNGMPQSQWVKDGSEDNVDGLESKNHKYVH